MLNKIPASGANVELINVGRNKVNKTIHVKNWKELGIELKKHLLSSEISISHLKDNRYAVVVGGLRVVGELVITKT